MHSWDKGTLSTGRLPCAFSILFLSLARDRCSVLWTLSVVLFVLSLLLPFQFHTSSPQKQSDTKTSIHPKTQIQLEHFSGHYHYNKCNSLILLTICSIESAIIDEIANNTIGISKIIFDLSRCRIFLLSYCCCCCISLLFISVEFCLCIFWLLFCERDRRVVGGVELSAPLLLAIVCCGSFILQCKFSSEGVHVYLNMLDVSKLPLRTFCRDKHVPMRKRACRHIRMKLPGEAMDRRFVGCLILLSSWSQSYSVTGHLHST